MDLEDYKKQLLIEPKSRDAAFLKAGSDSLDHARARKESDAFEAVLEDAAAVDVPSDLHEQIFEYCDGGTGTTFAARSSTWIAAAAVVFVAAIVAVVQFWPENSNNQPIQQAFVDHLLYPETRALSSQTLVADAEVHRAFGDMGAVTTGKFESVTYLSFCKIGGEIGVHMVTTDASGEQATAMYLPNKHIDGQISVNVDDVPGTIFNTPSGVAAVFAHSGDNLDAHVNAMSSHFTENALVTTR